MLGVSNIFASFLILIAVLLSILTIIALIGWWRGVENILFPGIGIVVAMPGMIILLLIINIAIVTFTAIIKPKNNPIDNAGISRDFEYPHDIFNGCGNGTLDVSLKKNPDEYNEKTDRPLKICINEDDLEAIQDLVVSGRIDYRNVSDDEFKKVVEHNKKLSEKFALQYPLLGKINDMYADYFFTPEELSELREECLKLQKQNPTAKADLALRKFLYAYGEAIKDDYYLMFSCD